MNTAQIIHALEEDPINDAQVSHFVKTHFRVSVKHPNLNFIQFSKKLVNKYCS